jgi:hypothetical protein
MGVFIPWLPGKFFHDEGYSNSYNFMKDVLLGICGLSSIAVNVHPMVEVTLAHRPGELLVQLVNASGHYGTSYWAPVPLYDQEIRLKLGREPSSCVRSGNPTTQASIMRTARFS